MAFDGIVLNSVVSELRSCLINGKVNKIYEPDRNEIIIELYSSGNSFSLLINAQPEIARFHYTTHSKVNPFNAPNFCMLLRKHLVGAKLIQINTFDLERIAEFIFETRNELNDIVVKKLIVQVMSSHSNIILVNKDDVIIDSIKHVSLPGTEIMPARPYSLPLTTKQSFVNLNSFDEFKSVVLNAPEDPIDKVLSDNFIGVSRSFVQSLMRENTDLNWIYNQIKNILQNIDKVSLKNSENDYFVCIKDTKSPMEVNNFLDNYYHQKETKMIFLQKRNKLLGTISSSLKKYSKRLDNINLKLAECENMDKYRIYGELLTSNLYHLNSQENLESVTVENYYDNQKEITIPLDKKFSLGKNIDLLFKKYNKLKNTLQIVGLQKAKTEIELEYIQSILFSIENSSSVQELDDIASEIEESEVFKSNFRQLKAPTTKTKQELISKPLEYNIDGYVVFVGKNNRQNDFLTLKMASNQDIWFHAQNVQGSHVILRVSDKPVTDSIILKCAILAAQNSRAKNSTNVSVDYCFIKNVKKAPGQKPGMVIYNDYKTIIVSLS